MIIETKIANLEKLDNDLIEIRFVKEYKVHVSDLLEIQKAFKGLTSEAEKYPVMAVPGRYGGLAKEAKGIDMLEVFRDRVRKLALVVPNIRQKLLAKFYFDYITQPSYEYKLFTDEQEAKTWLGV